MEPVKQKLFEIIKTSKIIMGLYQKLFELEIDNKKDNEDYQKTMNNLKTVIQYEDTLYDELTYKDAVYCQKYIETLIKSDYTNNTLLSIMYNKDFNPNIRIHNRLSSMIKSSPEYIKNNMDTSNVSEKTVIKSGIASKTIEEYFDNDFYLSLIGFLRLYLISDETKHLSKSFIKSKYNIVFLNKSFEKEAIEYNLDFPSMPIYLCSDLISDYYGLDKDFIHDLRVDYYSTVAIKTISNLLVHCDDDLDNDETFANISIMQAIIRSCLLRFSPAEAEILSTSADSILTNPIYLSEHQSDEVIRHFLQRCFDLHEIDQSKVNIVSFKK